ncbi:Aste57867_12728 [Aphanomyces stellatus]|uniref:Aste57867_12728 protein n=1 Tax=Aphanomyces stellatus TaxID=120398 RepID=A0A485KYC8_9STRA|nr:hypothetical protein As57867_012680 [Aphanomyces stellatus]VFT89578.1 Aste57867_12728 [Aphanomyces stellatus]
MDAVKAVVQGFSARISHVLPIIHLSTAAEMDPLILGGDDIHGRDKASSSSSSSSDSILPIPTTTVHLDPLVVKKHERVGLYLQLVGGSCLSVVAVLVHSAARHVTVDGIVFWRSAIALGVTVALQRQFGMPLLHVDDDLRPLVLLQSVLSYVVATLSFDAFGGMHVSDAAVVLASAPALVCLAGSHYVRLGRTRDGLEWVLGGLPLLGLFFVQGPLDIFPYAPLTHSGVFAAAFFAAVLSGVIWMLTLKLHQVSPLPILTCTFAVSTALSFLKMLISREASCRLPFALKY